MDATRETKISIKLTKGTILTSINLISAGSGIRADHKRSTRIFKLQVSVDDNVHCQKVFLNRNLALETERGDEEVRKNLSQ